MLRKLGELRQGGPMARCRRLAAEFKTHCAKRSSDPNAWNSLRRGTIAAIPARRVAERTGDQLAVVVGVLMFERRSERSAFAGLPFAG